VLNADYTPLSYYPLSLWPWQTAVKAMFLERVDVVAHYEREVHSPSRAAETAVGDRASPVRAAERISGLHAVQSVPPRPLSLRLLRVAQGVDVRPCRAALPGRPTTWENVATACAPCNLRKGGRTPRQAGMHIEREPIRPTSWQLQDHGRSFPPNYLHETWRDYLYWDIELDP
jgi:5-methylcytosine-specific restriction endonuclease McrA